MNIAIIAANKVDNRIQLTVMRENVFCEIVLLVMNAIMRVVSAAKGAFLITAGSGDHTNGGSAS